MARSIAASNASFATGLVRRSSAPGFDDLHGRRDVAVTRQENDWQMRSHFVQASLQLGPAEPRYPDIEKDAAAAGVPGQLRQQCFPDSYNATA